MTSCVTRDSEFEEEMRGQVVLTLDRDVKTGLTSDHDSQTWKQPDLKADAETCQQYVVQNCKHSE